MIIDAHLHLWDKQHGMVNGKPVYDIGGGKSDFGGVVRQMMPAYMTDGVNSVERLIANMDFAQVNGEGYVADSWSEAPFNTEYLHNGFISAYSQHSAGEDFAEMLSIYVTNDQEYWDAQLEEAGAASAEFIQAKLDIVRDYMKTSWSIDIDELRETINRRQKDIVSGKIDLTDLTLN